MKGKKQRSRPRKSSNFRVRGKGPLNAALSNTSAGGAFVATRFEIDTTLCNSWQQLGQSFLKWRINKLIFHFTTLKSTTTEGNVGIMILEDTNETTPTSTSTALGARLSRLACIHQNVTLVYKPNSGWLFTRDAVASTDDRLEMPGDVVFWTENTAAAFVPGVPWVEYDIEFKDVANSTIAPMLIPKPTKSLTDKSSQCLEVSNNNNEEPEFDRSELDQVKAMVKFLAKTISEMKSQGDLQKQHPRE